MADEPSPTTNQPATQRPCPFCGDDLIFWNHGFNQYSFSCQSCGMQSGRYEGKEAVMVAVNRRIPEPMTSVIRWVRYDGTPETLPEMGWYCLYVSVFWDDNKNPMQGSMHRYRSAKTDGINWSSQYFSEDIPVIAGDMWAYLPHLPESHNAGA